MEATVSPGPVQLVPVTGGGVSLIPEKTRCMYRDV